METRPPSRTVDRRCGRIALSELPAQAAKSGSAALEARANLVELGVEGPPAGSNER